MRPIFLFTAACLLGCTSLANASSLVASTDTLGSSLANSVQASSNGTSSSFGNDKIVLDARDDAASYVGSAGAVRGVYLEAALQHIRQQAPDLQATDMQLAEAILAL